MRRLAGILLTVLTVAVFSFLAASCSSNQPPVIDNLSADSLYVTESGTALISCQASDPDKSPLSYAWQADNGTIEGHSSTALWQAPSERGAYLITVTVSDAHGYKTTGQLHMTVVANAPPIIESLVADPSAVGARKTGFIACTAHDPEGDNLTYAWEVDKGQISGDGSTVSWLAPDGQGTCNVKVTVTDTRGNSAVMSTSITILPNHAPSIKSLVANPSNVVGGKSSTITCEAEDADEDLLDYTWQTSAGMISGEGNKLTWTSPTDCQQATVTVTVSDGRGGTAAKTVTIAVHKAGG